ncbi:uncharacterized protein LOC108903577 [Anoplophora glabripennis]|uniref:uncharacterized protein LOC108903577 n=1 Tax=Anoplophora glabripennis TaxID=217634 RepID=UPI0008740F36|nr:uncharacterized protein LOC108903577 [Anoplophora glabripennis]
MKFLFVLALAVIGATAAPSVEDDNVVDRIKELINTVLVLIPEPLLDIHDEKAYIDLGFEQLNVTLENVVISGIKNWEVSTLTFDEDSSRIDYVLTAPDIEASIELDILLNGILEADNHPVVNVKLSNLQLTGRGVLDTASSPHKVTDFYLLGVLEDGKVDLTGILNDDVLSEKLETLFNEKLATMVNDLSVQLEPIISPLAKGLVNLIIRLTS